MENVQEEVNNIKITIHNCKQNKRTCSKQQLHNHQQKIHFQTFRFQHTFGYRKPNTKRKQRPTDQFIVKSSYTQITIQAAVEPAKHVKDTTSNKHNQHAKEIGAATSEIGISGQGVKSKTANDYSSD